MNNERKVVFITGSYPPDICGVGDYTHNLKHLLGSANNYFSYEIFYKMCWDFKFLIKYYREILDRKANIIHLQYPTEGYHYSLVPLLLLSLLVRSKRVLTLHELSSRNLLAYLYSQALVFFADRVIVTNEKEAFHARKFMLWNKSKVSVVPIGSNIPESLHSKRAFSERKFDIAYFGHIRPNKGIEQFLDLIKIGSVKNLKRCAIIGQSLPSYKTFYLDVLTKARELKIDVFENYDAHSTAELLSNIKMVYLPFPDGVSLRRGSLLASLINGCVIVTTKSSFQDFNTEYGKYFFLTETIEDALDQIDGVLSDQKTIPNIPEIFRTSFSWETVIRKHLEIYKKL